MKKILGGLFFVLYGLTASCQILNFETGKLFSSFDYKDSQGKSLDGLKSSSYNNLGIGIRYALFYTPWHVSLNANYNRYAAKGSDPVLGNYYEWDATYLGTSLGVDYEFFQPDINRNEQHGFSFYLKASVAAEFLLDGTQNVNNQITDLSGVEEFDKPFYFVRGGIGVNFYISKTFILFAQYMGGRSFLIGNYQNKEQLHIISHNVSIGLAINLMYAR